jgi:hypothetical protein
MASNDPPAPAPDHSAQHDVSEAAVKEACELAQRAWYALLGVTAFLTVVVLSTADADFLVGSKQTEIPLIKVSVPTERFFFLAPIVATVLYANLHVYCRRLWTLARDAEPDVLKRGVGASLVGDIALYLKPKGRPRGGSHWANLPTLAAALLIWVAHPAVLAWALARSQAADRVSWLSPDSNPHLALLLPSTVVGITVLCLAISGAIAVASFSGALAIRYDHPARGWVATAAVLAAFLLPFLVGGDRIREWLPAVNLDRQTLARIEGGWLFAEERRETYRRDWCEAQEVPLKVCGNVPARTGDMAALIAEQRLAYCRTELGNRSPRFCAKYFDNLDAAFLADWKKQRTAELKRLPALNLDGRELSGASAAGAKFINARLEQARLEGANLTGADFEGAAMKGARLTGAEAYYVAFDRANLTGAALVDANLTSSTFEGASLARADLRAAILLDAYLATAGLQDADLTGADLTGARVGRANLTKARLYGTVLDGVDLSQVTGLSQEQLADAVGDARTILPAAPDGDALTIASCWEALPAAVLAVIEILPEPRAARSRERLEEHRCPRGDRPEPISTPRAPAPVPPPDPRVVARELEKEWVEERTRVEAALRREAAQPPTLSEAVLRPMPRPSAPTVVMSARNAP